MAETLAQKIQRAITAQQQEVDRLAAVAQVELPAARQRLNRLEAMLTRANQNVEDFYALLFDFKIVV